MQRGVYQQPLQQLRRLKVEQEVPCETKSVSHDGSFTAARLAPTFTSDGVALIGVLVRLETLEVRGWSHHANDDDDDNGGTRPPAAFFHRLHSLRLVGCCPQALKESMAAISAPTSLLQHLCLAGCWTLTDAEVRGFVCTVQHLTHLSLLCCRQLSNRGIELLTQELRALRTLHLSGCANVDDDSLRHIASNLMNLRDLKISSCWSITDCGLAYLQRESALRFLERLDLVCCSELTDVGLLAISSCTTLRHLALGGCWKVTDVGISYICSSLHQLEYLRLVCCPLVSICAVGLLEASLPNLSDVSYGTTAGVLSIVSDPSVVVGTPDKLPFCTSCFNDKQLIMKKKLETEKNTIPFYH